MYDAVNNNEGILNLLGEVNYFFQINKISQSQNMLE